MLPVLGWLEAVFCTIGVVATAGFIWWWVASFFVKQRELNALDADARVALKDAAAGWKESAQAQKETRETERRQLEAEIAKIKVEFNQLSVDLSEIHDVRASETALIEWIVDRSVEQVLKASEEADVFMRMVSTLGVLSALRGQRLEPGQFDSVGLEIIELAGAAIKSQARCTSATSLGRAILTAFRCSPDATFDQLFDEASADVRSRRDALMPSNMRLAFQIMSETKKN